MNKITNWFYSTSFYYRFRHYFIRKKSPLSWILWGEILRRKSISVGAYQTSIATAGEPDCTISLRRGAPGENNIEMHIYDGKGDLVDIVKIPLGYKAMGRVMDGFRQADRISRKKIREENAIAGKS